MVQIKGWGGVKPYWWCDNSQNRAVKTHIEKYLPQPHPCNGIFIKGLEKRKPDSIEINNINESNIVNINTISGDTDQLLIWVEQIRLIMEDAIIDNLAFKYKGGEHFKKSHTYNLQYTWQQLDKKSKHLEP